LWRRTGGVSTLGSLSKLCVNSLCGNLLRLIQKNGYSHLQFVTSHRIGRNL
jgi:hypothetical protein